ncbi:MAG TPA: hypothetical protein PK400_11530, partial [Phycisphaerales bacterium]|nr:hypothetical protein [Phycisphaerales bacterium]
SDHPFRLLFSGDGTIRRYPAHAARVPVGGSYDYRVSIGTGIRLYIPQLGPVPIAFDFGFPVLKQSRDEKQLLTFSAELPF